MASQTVHRGPDDEGRFLDRKVALGMRRLSIIDVSGGHQPISNEDQSVWVVCNGEIYNFRELRDDLLRRGHIFSSGSDTEVLVHLYEEFGDQFVERLRGMFAFALWDCRRRRLLLARDRLGIKPLYYHTSSGRFVFASEAKAILGIPGFTASLDPDALSEYLALGYVPAPLSMFEGIRKLLPGTLMVRESGRDVVQPYWNLSGDPVEGDSSYTEEEWAGLLREVLDRSVESQMVSDVPLGAFLSGGVDSSAVVGLMAQHSSQPVRTYSIGFETQGAGLLYNELPYARAVAQRFGTKHREIVVRPDVVSLLPKLIWHLDEPVADSAFVTTFLVSEFARKEVTVILSGVGGDELFGGYRRYLGGYYGRYYRMIPAFIRRGLIAPMASRLPSDRHSRWLNLARYARSFLMSSELPLEHRYRRYVEVLGNADLNSLLLDRHREPFDALGRAFDRFGGGDELDTLLRIDLATQLPDDLLMLTDRMSMATSLECRVPLLDESLLDLAMRIPSSIRVRGRNLKYIFKKSLEDLLPAEILYREKRGFGAPVGSWIKQELSSMLERVLSRESIQRRGLMSWEAVDRMIRLHRANREDYTDSLLALLNLELWCRLYIDNESAGGIAEELAAEVA